jgi:hypothetical protein
VRSSRVRRDDYSVYRDWIHNVVNATGAFVYDSFNEPMSEPSGARSRPGLALAVVALAAAGLTGAVVGGAAWTFDRYTGSASADDPTALGFDGLARSSPAPASSSPGTPGWAETLVLPVPPAPAASGSATIAGDTAGRPAPMRPGPVARRATGMPDRPGEATLDPGARSPGPTGSVDPAPSDPLPSETGGTGGGTGGLGGDGATGATGDGATGGTGDGGTGPVGGTEGDTDGDGGTGPVDADGGGAPDDTAASAQPTPSPSATPGQSTNPTPARWFIFHR